MSNKHSLTLFEVCWRICERVCRVLTNGKTPLQSINLILYCNYYLLLLTNKKTMNDDDYKVAGEVRGCDDKVENCLSNLKMKRERDPVSRGDKECRKEARYLYDDIRFLLQLQKESIEQESEKKYTQGELQDAVYRAVGLVRDTYKEQNHNNLIDKFKEEVREIIEDGETAKGELFDEICQKMLNI